MKIRETLDLIEEAINEDKINYLNVVRKFEDFKNIWDKHEKREEHLLYFFQQLGRPFPVESMFLEQHRELRGHWKVLENAMKLNDVKKLDVVLDTDGRMLINKIRGHINKEDRFFEMFVVKKEVVAENG